jgi:CubicO group peptidase (beta-lactamase class C family)
MDRRQLLKVAALVGGGAAALSAAPAQAASRTLSGSVGGYGPALERIGAYVELHRRTYNLPGLTLSVADGDGFSALITSGQADVGRGEAVSGDHLFQIGSISKSLVALALFRQVEAGRLSLGARIVEVLPGAPFAVDSPVSVQHLLSHSGGLPDGAPLFPRMNNGLLWSDFTPGSRWSYSNTGYELLGALLEHLHGGQPLHLVLEHEVLGPLGMDGARGAILVADRPLYAGGYAPLMGDRPYPLGGPLDTAPWVDVTEGDGCVAATAPQMAGYLAWLIGATGGKGGPLLGDALVRQYLTPVIDAPDWTAGAKYANGLAIVKVGARTLVHHTGGMPAFSSSLHVDPAARVGAFASTNVGMSGYRPRDITTHACALLRWIRDGGPEPVAPPMPDRDVAKPRDYVGRFTAGDGETLDIAADGKGLALTAGGSTLPLEPRGPDRFLAGQARFSRHVLLAERQGGKVRSFWWGGAEFLAPGVKGDRPIDPTLQALSGRYDNDSPWGDVNRFIARPDGLWADADALLKLLPDGSWRVAIDPAPPERIVFDSPISGRPHRMTFSGVDYVRRSE